MIHITYLGSGSKGNSALLEFGEKKYLFDAGFSCQYLQNSLKTLGISVQDLSGIFITHDHSDHISGLRVLLKNMETPVFASHGTFNKLLQLGISPSNKVFLKAEVETEIDGLRLWPFLLPHDAHEPLGVRIEYDQITLSLATDLGHITPAVMTHLIDCDILCLESNYDETMLANCSYPVWLKKRIESPWGHLSNKGVRGILSRLKRNLSHLVLVHVSQESNTPELVRENLSPLLGFPMMKNTVITVTTQNSLSPTLSTSNNNRIISMKGDMCLLHDAPLY